MKRILAFLVSSAITAQPAIAGGDESQASLFKLRSVAALAVPEIVLASLDLPYPIISIKPVALENCGVTASGDFYRPSCYRWTPDFTRTAEPNRFNDVSPD